MSHLHHDHHPRRQFLKKSFQFFGAFATASGSNHAASAKEAVESKPEGVPVVSGKPAAAPPTVTGKPAEKKS